MARGSAAAATVRRLLPAVAASVAGLALLLGLQLTVVRGGIESRLANEVRQELRGNGIDGVDVSVEGRDVLLTATNASADQLANAADAVRGIEGVRIARTVAATLPGGDDEPAESGTVQLTVSLVGGRISLTGAVPGERPRERLVEAANAVVGSQQVDDQVLVAPGGDGEGVEAVIAAVGALDPAFSGSLELTGGTVELSGRMPDQEARDGVVAAAGGVLNDPSRIVDLLSIETESLTDADRAVQARLQALDELEFMPGTSRLRSSADDVVEEVAEILAAAPDLRLRIEGHTDDSGSVAGNLRLGLRRAEEVRDALAEAGLDEARLDAIGYGERRTRAVDPTTGVPTPTATDGAQGDGQGDGEGDGEAGQDEDDGPQIVLQVLR